MNRGPISQKFNAELKSHSGYTKDHKNLYGLWLYNVCRIDAVLLNANKTNDNIIIGLGYLMAVSLLLLFFIII